MSLYVDTSAAVKLLVEEAESDALRSALGDRELASTDLVETELRRYAVRHALPQEDVTAILDRIDLVALDRAAFREAGLIGDAALRSLDALHLVGALRLDVEAVVTYDERMMSAARGLGLAVLAPGV